MVQPISLLMAHFNVEHSAQISRDTIATAQEAILRGMYVLQGLGLDVQGSADARESTISTTGPVDSGMCLGAV